MDFCILCTVTPDKLFEKKCSQQESGSESEAEESGSEESGSEKVTTDKNSIRTPRMKRVKDKVITGSLSGRVRARSCKPGQ